MFKLTPRKALEIQARQCANLEPHHPGITELVRQRTNTDGLDMDVQYDVIEINKHIPRGGAIERIAGIADQGSN